MCVLHPAFQVTTQFDLVHVACCTLPLCMGLFNELLTITYFHSNDSRYSQLTSQTHGYFGHFMQLTGHDVDDYVHEYGAFAISNQLQHCKNMVFVILTIALSSELQPTYMHGFVYYNIKLFIQHNIYGYHLTGKWTGVVKWTMAWTMGCTAGGTIVFQILPQISDLRRISFITGKATSYYTEHFHGSLLK